MDPSFGTRLRVQREQRQVAISTIAADTKINPTLLEALERDDVSQWPTGIFRRAYIRAYARAIGLDPDVVVREFLELYPDSVDVLPAGVAVWPDPAPAADGQASGRLGRLVTSARAAVPAILRRPGRRDTPTATLRTGDAAGDDVVGAAVVTGAATPPDPVVEGLHVNGVRGEAQAPEVDPETAMDPGEATGPGVALEAGEQAAAAAEPMAEPPSAADTPRPKISLAAAADLCARLARARDGDEVAMLVGEAARILDAVGVILWWPHGSTPALSPLLVHGYPDAMRARLPRVPFEAANAVAAAYRSAEVCLVEGDGVTGAVVVPLTGRTGCGGVLAVEVRSGMERDEPSRAFATLVAAQLAAALLHEAGPAESGAEEVEHFAQVSAQR